MSSIRLVNFISFLDSSSRLLTAGIDGFFLFDLHHTSKYSPLQSAQLDPEGKSTRIELKNKIQLDKMPLWAKGFRLQGDKLVGWN